MTPHWRFALPPNCTWSAPYLSTGFKLAAGILSMNTGDRGQRQPHTQAHRHLVSVHSSFDNKNTSLELRGEHKTERKGCGDYVTCAGGSVTDSNNNNANLFFFNGKILHTAFRHVGVNSRGRAFVYFFYPNDWSAACWNWSSQIKQKYWSTSRFYVSVFALQNLNLCNSSNKRVNIPCWMNAPK